MRADQKVLQVGYKTLTYYIIYTVIFDIFSCNINAFFTAQCYASVVLAVALCLSVRLSQVSVLVKQLNVGSHKQHHTIAQGL